jgi:2-succinyl-5-enolpyruvyl-6-hydroxy-3-cyclohexene-1-carboxylate synthase
MSAIDASSFLADPTTVYTFVGRFFNSLRTAGVQHVVLSPGSRSTPLSICADQTDGLRTWIQLDERSAAFFALGLAKATRRPVALVCTSGTAAANYFPAIIEAYYSRVPLIVLTADRPPELRDWGAGQTIEQGNLYGRYSRWSVEVPIPMAGDAAWRVADRIASRAVSMALARPSGAVHLNWPLREPLAPPVDFPPSSQRAEESSGIRFTEGRVSAEPEDVRELVAMIRSTERGLILCGPMDIEAPFALAIAEFATAAGWPILADPASQLRGVSEALGAPILDMGDGLARAGRFRSEMQPNFVLRIGDSPVSKAQRLWIEASAPKAVWWLDEGGQWGEPSHLATRVVRGGGHDLLATASRELVGHPGRESEWCRSFESVNAIARKVMVDHNCAEDSWSGLAATKTVTRSIPQDGVLFVSNSMSIRFLDLVYANRGGGLRVLCSRGASGIDGTISTALGIAAAGRPTLLLTGDLAFLHDLGGLLISRREALPLSIVVLDDNGGGIFSFLPVAARGKAIGFDRLFRTPHDVDLSRAAGLFELDYRCVIDLPSLASALHRSWATAGVSIIHARFDAEENESAFRECVTKICDAVDGGLGVGASS